MPNNSSMRPVQISEGQVHVCTRVCAQTIIFLPCYSRRENSVLVLPVFLGHRRKASPGVPGRDCTHPLRGGSCSSPASRPCTGGAVQGPDIATPHG